MRSLRDPKFKRPAIPLVSCSAFLGYHNGFKPLCSYPCCKFSSISLTSDFFATGRLEPGKIFLVDLKEKRIVHDAEMKAADQGQEDVTVQVVEVDRARSRSPAPPEHVEVYNLTDLPPKYRRKFSISAMVKNSKDKGAYSSTRNILRKAPPSLTQAE